MHTKEKTRDQYLEKKNDKKKKQREKGNENTIKKQYKNISMRKQRMKSQKENEV